MASFASKDGKNKKQKQVHKDSRKLRYSTQKNPDLASQSVARNAKTAQPTQGADIFQVLHRRKTEFRRLNFLSWPRLLGFEDKLFDGMEYKYSDRELLVVSKQDQRLHEFVAYCRGLTEDDEVRREKKVESISEAVCNALGGPQNRPPGQREEELSELVQKYVKDSYEKHNHHTMLLGETFCGGSVFGDDAKLGAGLSHHRSMLFKYVCDELGTCDCAMLDGKIPPTFLDCESAQYILGFAHTWNVVHIDGQNYVVDHMNFPGELLNSMGLNDLPVQFLRVSGRSGLSLKKPIETNATLQRIQSMPEP